MRVAIPHWQGRISPVLDVAGTFLLVDIEQGEESGRQNITLPEEDTMNRARRIKDLDADIVVCGAISRPLASALTSRGIEVVAQICGEVELVLEALLKGRLQQDMFLMPGCCRGRRRFRGGRGRFRSS